MIKRFVTVEELQALIKSMFQDGGVIVYKITAPLGNLDYREVTYEILAGKTALPRQMEMQL